MAIRNSDNTLLWSYLCGLTVVVMALALVLPLSNFVGHPHWERIKMVPFTGIWTWSDFLANTVLFVPFGFCFQRALPDPAAVWKLALIAALLSLSGELYQSFSHNRIPTMTDVLANTLGALLGAALALRSMVRAKHIDSIRS